MRAAQLSASSCALLCLVATASAAEPAKLWVLPGAGALGTRVERVLSSVLRARGKALALEHLPEIAEPSLRPALAQALEAYRAGHFDEAAAALSALSSTAQRTGGGDLDTRALADLYLHLALSAQEQGATDLAWDSFVRAVRIDPTRALDPAQVPPRATAAQRRAQTELGQAPAIELELRIASEARAHLDGDEGHGPGPLGRRLIPGPHFVRVERSGYELYRGVVSLSSANEIFAPALRPRVAPAPTDEDDANGYATLQRAAEGWRLSYRARVLGTVVEAAAPIREEDADRVVEALVDRVYGRLATPPTTKPVWKRWWVWTIAGVAVAAVAVAIPVAIIERRGSAAGSVGGSLDPVAQ